MIVAVSVSVGVSTICEKSGFCVWWFFCFCSYTRSTHLTWKSLWSRIYNACRPLVVPLLVPVPVPVESPSLLAALSPTFSHVIDCVECHSLSTFASCVFWESFFPVIFILLCVMMWHHVCKIEIRLVLIMRGPFNSISNTYITNTSTKYYEKY